MVLTLVPDRFNMDNGDLGLKERTSNDVQDIELAPTLDPAAFPYMTSTNPPDAFYPTNPGGLSAAFPNPPSDLFPSENSMTPVSLSYQLMNSNAPIAPTNPMFHGFNPHYFPQQYNLPHSDKQPTMAPSSLSQSESEYPAVDDSGGQDVKPMSMHEDSWSLDGLSGPDHTVSSKTDTR